MNFSGQERITAPREIVWAALNDPEILKQCIPSCQSLEMKSPTELSAVVKIRLGPLSASFAGGIVLTNVQAPHSYTISAEGKGGIAGFAKGSADVRLAEDGDGTVMHYEARAEIGGRLAQLGSRFIDSTSKKFAERFFADFNEAVSARAEGVT